MLLQDLLLSPPPHQLPLGHRRRQHLPLERKELLWFPGGVTLVTHCTVFDVSYISTARDPTVIIGEPAFPREVA